jgi:hypothetical protein
MMKNLVLILILLTLGACMPVRPDPEIFQSAESAIATAEKAGADEHAPVEIRRAREKLSIARQAMENRDYNYAVYQVEESEINAVMATEQSRTAMVRRQVNELRRSNELLLEELQNNFGEAFQ